jgi:8-amino-7-oxononanoate synthase
VARAGGALLLVDEAHALGVVGADGRGAVPAAGLAGAADVVRTVTLSKSLGAQGGAVLGHRDVIAHLVDTARAFIFDTGLAPAAAGAALAALRVLRSPDGPPLLARVLANARRLRDGLDARGYAVVKPQALPGGGDVVTPIVPILVGDDWKAVLLWRALWDAGVFVNTALHPAVPPGGALLRTSVMATHDDATIDRALDAFASVKQRFEAEHGPLPSSH